MGSNKSDLIGSPLQQTLRVVEKVHNLVPRLLNELETEEQGALAEMVPAMVPRHASLSTRPCDYALYGGQTIPYRWLRPEQEQVLPAAPLRWIMHVIQLLHDDLQLHAGRLRKQVEVARLVRDGDSVYAVLDRHQLEHMLSEVYRGEVQVQRSLKLLQRRYGKKLSPSQYPPSPFPRSHSWLDFRRLSDSLSRKGKAMTPWLNELLSAPVPQADAPFLYQRWCGLQLLRSCERLGWEPSGEIRGALFLGGPLEIRRGEKKVLLWIEPRISTRTAHLTGWNCVEKQEELTPDFLLVCEHNGGRDAFTLDATLSTGQEAIAAKGRYRNRLQGVDRIVVAGVPVLRRPLRSWAVAPFLSRYCRLGDTEGWTGMIPLRVEQKDRSALDAWMGDVFRHAEAAGSSPA
ncbi:hypothetical protein [Geomonas agri]|uniref:hypothetical protein n=1 Tax=Geomonas agri TaxID=2873702 RepID=UPI001CD46153|nr:hypothetical protein [Geomonas agri]